MHLINDCFWPRAAGRVLDYRTTAADPLQSFTLLLTRCRKPMRARLDSFDSGASSLALELSGSEVESLIRALEKLRLEPDWHFHFRSSFEEAGIGDIEFSSSGSAEHEYLKLEI